MSRFYYVSLLQKHMKPRCLRYILRIGVSCGTLCGIALSIGVVSARGSRNTGKTRGHFSFEHFSSMYICQE